MALFAASASGSIGGFGREDYLAYVLWAAFVARITSSWMYEFRMIDEIESGSINGLLVRPMTFFEYYLSQLLGYKIVTTAISLLVPLAVCLAFKLPTHLERLPLCLLLVVYYLILVHSMSFVIACLAFHLNRISSFTVAKNLALWVLSGELFPLDLMAEPFKSVLISLPFSTAVYGPVSYLVGRTGIEVIYQGFYSTTLGILFFSALGWWMWRMGLAKYVGTGA